MYMCISIGDLFLLKHPSMLNFDSKKTHNPKIVVFLTGSSAWVWVRSSNNLYALERSISLIVFFPAPTLISSFTVTLFILLRIFGKHFNECAFAFFISSALICLLV